MELSGYSILGEVATGSTGTVFRAHQVALGRDVAIKVLDPALLAEAGFREQFRAEARTLAGLRDDHIVSVFEYVEDDRGAYLVQEWVDGASTEAVLATHGPLTPEQAVGVMRGALTGLAVAHRNGLVHGDVSTSNILVTTDGTSQLIDFGLAGPPGSRGRVGTPAFMSPEALQGAELSPRSDVYSACAVLARLLGVATPATGVSGARADHGEAITEVLGRGLAGDPAARPADASELLALLEDAATRRFGAGWVARSSVAGLTTGLVATTTSSPGDRERDSAGAGAPVSLPQLPDAPAATGVAATTGTPASAGTPAAAVPPQVERPPT